MKSSELKIFDQFYDQHLELTKSIFKADNRKAYSIDIYAISSLNRSMALCKGFQIMMETNNLICAGAIIRQQLDTLLRFFALFIVNDPHRVSMDIIAGEHLRNLVDKDGKKMTDRYLVNKLSDQYPWVKKVYQETSGYVHFSHKHIFSAVESIDGKRNISFKVSCEDSEEVHRVYREAIDCYIHITEIFLLYIRGWVLTKDGTHPDINKQQK